MEERLKRAPVGKIHIVNTKRRVQYYIRMEPSEKSGTYLPKTACRKIKSYLQKAYDEKTLRLVLKEKKSLMRFLKSTGEIQEQIRFAYSNYPREIKQNIEPIDQSDEDFAHEWLQKQCAGKPVYEVNGNYITENGEQVRSKSELLIANALHRNGIPYRYECPLQMPGGYTIHPDFTVLNSKKRKIMYWEHRGMMDDSEYSNHTVIRIREYIKAGIFPGDQLIISEETADSPLDTKEIEALINFYLKK